MKELIITKAMLDSNNNYIGDIDLSSFDGTVRSENYLGWIKFKSINVTGGLYFGVGCGIIAGGGIEAGGGIKAGWGIKAGGGIEAGWGIKAGGGIEAGLSITCKGILSFSYKCFAGICYRRDITDEEKTITCGKKEGTGVIEYGILKEIGLPKEENVVQELTMSEICEKLGYEVKIKKE